MLAALLLCACPEVPPAGCDAGLTTCDGTCTDLKLSDSNCGACGMACPSGQVCGGARCLAANCVDVDCTSAYACLDDRCAERACVGVVCPSNQACFKGACEPVNCGAAPCPSGSICSAEVCLDLQCLGVRCPAGSLAVPDGHQTTVDNSEAGTTFTVPLDLLRAARDGDPLLGYGGIRVQYDALVSVGDLQLHAGKVLLFQTRESGAVPNHGLELSDVLLTPLTVTVDFQHSGQSYALEVGEVYAVRPRIAPGRVTLSEVCTAGVRAVDTGRLQGQSHGRSCGVE